MEYSHNNPLGWRRYPAFFFLRGIKNAIRESRLDAPDESEESLRARVGVMVAGLDVDDSMRPRIALAVEEALAEPFEGLDPEEIGRNAEFLERTKDDYSRIGDALAGGDLARDPL